MINNANNFASQLGPCPSKTLSAGLPLGEDLFARPYVTYSPLTQYHIFLRVILTFGSNFRGPKTPLNTSESENPRFLVGWSRCRRPRQFGETTSVSAWYLWPSVCHFPLDHVRITLRLRMFSDALPAFVRRSSLRWHCRLRLVYLAYGVLSPSFSYPSRFFFLSLSRVGCPSFFKRRPSGNSWTYEDVINRSQPRFHHANLACELGD